MTLADSSKAFDAIITAIGIVAALIIVGTYVQLPPGGPMPPWAGCAYTLFTVYVFLNGMALVFSVAALIAVIFAPYILIRMHRCAWCRTVVQLGIYHSAVSLCALMAAFICAGLIRGAVSAPGPSCASLRCEEGGVPCSPYSVRFTSTLYNRIASGSRAFAGLTSLADTELLLDPTLVLLNRQHFADSKGGDRQADVVVCHNYGLLATTSGQQTGTDLGIPVNDTLGVPINKTCFALLDYMAFNASLTNSSHGSVLHADLGMLWCSSNRANVGPGWLPLTLDTVDSLLPADTYGEIRKSSHDSGNYSLHNSIIVASSVSNN